MTKDPSDSEGWLEHIPLIATGLVALIIAMRLLVIATWSRRTALAILQTGGTATVVTGVLVSTLGIAGGAALCLYLIVQIYSLLATKRRPTRTFWLMITAGLIWELLVVPLYMVVATVIVVAAAAVVGILRRRKWRSRVDRRRIGTFEVLAGSALVALIAIFADNRPWLPPENITLGPEQKVITGYVLQNDEHELVILQGSRPRQVVHIIEPEVVKREICGGTSVWWGASPLKNILGLTPYPTCLESF